MAITRNFRETIQARALYDAEFRAALLTEGLELLITGDVETGKSVLRDYINATLGFEKLAEMTEKSPKSLMRMFSHEGNPTANNLFSVISTLQKQEGVQLRIHTES